MTRVSAFVEDLWQSESGQDLVEYALLTALFAIAVGAIMPNAAQAMRSVYQSVDAVLARYA